MTVSVCGPRHYGKYNIIELWEFQVDIVSLKMQDVTGM
jgi:hypothetical protein